MVRWVYDLRKLALHGNLEGVQKYYKENRKHIDSHNTKSIVNAAAISGNLELLKWLEEHHFKRDPSCAYQAAMNKDYKMLEYLNDHTNNSTSGAAAAGHMDLLKWLRDPNTCGGVSKWGIIAMRNAVIRGDIEMVEFMRTPSEVGPICHWDKTTTDIAIKHSKLEMLKYLIRNGCPFDYERSYKYFENKGRDALLWFDTYA